MSGKGTKMNRKQQLFVREYLVDLNATAAAIRAGYSKKTARQHAARLLTNVYISAEIQKATAMRMQRLDITADQVLQELAKLAFFDVRELFNGDGSPKRIHELNANTAAGIAGFECFEWRIDLNAFMQRVRSLARLEGMQLFSQQLGIVSDEQKRKLKRTYDAIFASILARATRRG
jgi:phage terminase small subunit